MKKVNTYEINYANPNLKSTFVEKPYPGNKVFNGFEIYYNDVYGCATDTNMTYYPENDMYIIKGSLITNNKYWDNFIHSSSWGDVNFVKPFSVVCDDNNLEGNYKVLNGQICYILKRKQEAAVITSLK